MYFLQPVLEFSSGTTMHIKFAALLFPFINLFGKKMFHFVSTMCLHLVSKNFLIFVLVFAFVNNRVFLYDAEYVHRVSDF